VIYLADCPFRIPHSAITHFTRLRVICEMRIAKLRKGNLRNRLRNALWLVGRN